MRLETRFARLGRDRIAYQTLGEGPLVLVNAPGSFSHADVGCIGVHIAARVTAGGQPGRLEGGGLVGGVLDTGDLALPHGQHLHSRCLSVLLPCSSCRWGARRG